MLAKVTSYSYRNFIGERGFIYLSKNHEKAINLPNVITALLVLFVALQLSGEYGPPALSQFIYQTLAFVPERLNTLLFPQTMMDEVIKPI